MEPSADLSFGSCKLNLRTRELSLDGRARTIAPKVFDLIVFLVDRRHRVVTKDELQTALWAGQIVSDGAIARTVMLARQAVGSAAFIKTVHSVGYRFTGDVQSPQPDPQGKRPGGMFRVGVLPFENKTGDARLDWTELGLAAMVEQALDAEPSLSSPSLQEVLAAVAPLGAAAPVAERLAAATDLLGLDACVHAVLRRQGQALWLEYRIQGAGRDDAAGSLRSEDPAELGRQAADAIHAALLPGKDAATALVSQDPFINQAFARAAQLQAQHQFRAAARLLAVVIEFEPASLAARQAFVFALANLEDPDTDAQATELAELAAARGDRRTQARALIAAGAALALSEIPDGFTLAAQRMRSAQPLAAPYATEDWAVRMHLIGAWIALQRGELHESRRMYALVEGATATDNRLQLALTLDGRAALELACGERLKAKALLERSLQIYRDHRMHSTSALTCMNLAHVCMQLGMRSRSLELARLSESLLPSVQQPHVAASVAKAAALVYAEDRSCADIDRVLKRLEPPDGSRTVGSKGQWVVACGLRALCAGEFEKGRAWLMRSIAMARSAGAPVRLARRLQLLLELEMAAGATGDWAGASQAAMAHLQAYADADLQATLDMGQAAQLVERHDIPGAAKALESALVNTTPGRMQALVRMNSAWLRAELGQLERVPELIRPIGTWMEEHPLGRALRTRLASGREAPPITRLPSLA